MKSFKPVKSELEIKDNTITVINELGFKETYKIFYTSFVETELYEPENCKMCALGIPELNTSFKIMKISDDEKTETAVEQKQIKEILKNRNMIPENLDYTTIHIGFVYSEGDPQNHRWMLNFFNSNNQNVYVLFCDTIDVFCPISTVSWEDNIWHGRFVINKNDIDTIIEPTYGHLIIQSKKNELVSEKHKDMEEATDLRLRFNIRENKWYCDYLKDEEILSTTIVSQILCGAPLKGVVKRGSQKPQVSMYVKTEDIANIQNTSGTLIISGKTRT